MAAVVSGETITVNFAEDLLYVISCLSSWCLQESMFVFQHFDYGLSGYKYRVYPILSLDM